MLKVQRIDSGFYNTSMYLLSNGSGESLLVDCGSFEDVKKALAPEQKIVGVLLTHVHCDHIYGLNMLLEQFPDVVIYTNDYGRLSLRDVKMNMSLYNELPFTYNGEKVSSLENVSEMVLLGERFEVMCTPGHDPSCITYKMGDCLFTGDSYIPGVRVVTTFPRSNKQQAQKSVELLKQMETDGCKIFAGHHI